MRQKFILICYLCYLMNKKDYNTLKQALLKQKREVSASKTAAKAFLKKAGVLHLLVPKEDAAQRITPKSA
ncbi:hypothetical protein [Niabella hirudinis]|uniref:hypothetical protein n=1 Tax=Niabella hirudinis TaxID=1285929 RepID=UPI003EB9E555